jgi:hypothetical protein
VMPTACSSGAWGTGARWPCTSWRAAMVAGNTRDPLSAVIMLMMLMTTLTLL